MIAKQERAQVIINKLEPLRVRIGNTKSLARQCLIAGDKGGAHDYTQSVKSLEREYRGMELQRDALILEIEQLRTIEDERLALIPATEQKETATE